MHACEGAWVEGLQEQGVGAGDQGAHACVNHPRRTALREVSGVAALGERPDVLSHPGRVTGEDDE